MDKNNCALCDKKLSFWNQPVFGKGILMTQEKICSSCFMRINNTSPKTASNLKKYRLDEIKVLLDTKTKHGIGFDVKTVLNSPIDTDSDKWEIVHRKTDRWNELGFGDNDKFPGYGRLYEREFEVWYCEIGSKERKDIKRFTDKYPLNYDPKNYKDIVGEGVYLEHLTNTKDYAALYTALDNINRKRWYFALISSNPLWIQTERAIEKEEQQEEQQEKKPEIEVPEGWTLVRRNSKDWIGLGFGDDELFPGYGRIYERTFEVWYCEIGSKEKVSQPDFEDKAILNHYNGICGDLGELKGKGLQFDSLEKTQGYKSLLTTVDKQERKRWYFGLKDTTPTYIYTDRAE